MTTLVLVRHAKSDWGDPGLDDHDRPLNARGLRDAPALAARLAGTGIRLEAVLSSTALRARTTASFFAEAFGLDAELDGDLYGAAAARLLRAAADRGVPAVMVVAHDPGMTALAERLSGGGIGHMPTCAVATFVWATDDWDVATATDPEQWSFDRP
ncbi:SixA phosphatase family protein [Microbacterium hominis]|uniref:SixA phosphatase family protein n=1 Tax=Microbacterium hominis TaxID=162426 RepID=UPI00076855E5|nr:histidine phosphatase family protein [Microbacterium hominis]KXC06248.1 phosphohistidine phosphatase [Microbacterium hominis]